MLLGGGGLVAVNVYASAGEGKSGQSSPRSQNVGQASTIVCPDVANEDRLAGVPKSARAEVDRELAKMDTQITEAYQRFADEKAAIAQDSKFVDNAILGPLKAKRTAALDRISIAMGRSGERPQGLESLSACTMKTDETLDQGGGQGNGQNGGQNGGQGQGQNGGQGNGQNGGQGQGQNGGQGNGQDGGQNGGQDGGDQGGGGGQAGNGPEAGDFVDITSVQPNVKQPQNGGNASTGTFATNCGVNENGLFNSDNVIVAPGVTNGAHHMHDYVGNQGNSRIRHGRPWPTARPAARTRATSPRITGRSCASRTEQDGATPSDGGGKEGNVGEIQTRPR